MKCLICLNIKIPNTLTISNIPLVKVPRECSVTALATITLILMWY